MKKIPVFRVKNREDNQIELIWQDDGKFISFLLDEDDAVELYNNLAKANEKSNNKKNTKKNARVGK